MKSRWRIGQAVHLATALQTPVGTLPAGAAGEILDLTTDRARVRFEAGEVWVDLVQLQAEYISLDESRKDGGHSSLS
jgi:hypothetical protein